jgi:CDP-paratose 2-epimerase
MKRKSTHRSALIFGGAGFIGSNWAHYLLRNSDAAIQVFDNLSRPGSEHNLKWLRQEASGTSRFRFVKGDVRDRASVSKAVQSATEIYHFAAQVAVTTSVDDPRTDFEINAGGTFNVLEAARGMSTPPFLLFTSTNKVYGDIDRTSKLRVAESSRSPILVNESQALDFYSPYGCSKGTADQYVRDYARIYGIPSVVFRMSCIAGPRQFGNEDQGWVAHFIYSALRDQLISIYGDGTQVRDVLAVSDLVRAFDAVQEARQQAAGEVFNVGGGAQNAVALLGLISKLEQATGKRVRRRFYPRRPGDQHVYVTDFSKLQKLVHWSPRMTIDDTVNAICQFWAENHSLLEPAGHPISASTSSVLQILPEVAS